MADEDRDDEDRTGEAAAGAAALAALVALLTDDVRAALKEPDETARQAQLRDLAITAFALAYEATGGGATGATHATPFAGSLAPAFALLQPDGSDAQEQRMAEVIAHAAINAATVAAADTGGDAASAVKLEWRTQRDDRVRDLHIPLDGQVRAAGTTFDVGGHPLRYPGEPVGPPEVWMNCRCFLQPAGTPITAAAEPPKGAVVVARPADPIGLAVPGGLPPDELHVTLGYYGDAESLDPEISRLLEYFVTHNRFSTDASVGGRGVIGSDDPPAVVLLLESPDLATVRSTLEKVADPDRTHPHFTPHITLGYGVDLPETLPTTITLDRIELWRGGERIGGDMVEPATVSAETDLTAASTKPWSQFSASDYTIEQWRRACILTMPGGDPESKSTYKLPIREPGGALNVNGVHAAASRFGQTDAPPEALAKAKAKLRGAYRQLGETPPDSLKADALLAWGPSTSPPGTHDAPGWLTNPRETQRLRTYWTKGEGAAKIAWGTPNDLTRCAKHLAKYVLPEHVWGTCQNLHYEALGYWNPESEPGGRRASINFDEINAAITAVFAAATDLEDIMPPPRALFDDPQLTAATPLTLVPGTDYHEVVGHLAQWDTCHVGITEQCVTPPRTAANYAYFRTGEVETDNGPVPVGHITAGTKHAETDQGAAETVRHYDHTGTVVADVAVGEDDYGIWAHGIARPGISEDQMYALRAGAPSGDWRRIGGNLELVGALIVNVPGFPIPRPELAASAGRDLALVAAGVVTTDPNADIDERVAVAVIARLDERDRRMANTARVAALQSKVNAERVAELTAAVGMSS